MGEDIPDDTLGLYVKMWQENLGITESVTPLEIEHALGTNVVRGSLEVALQLLCSHELAEEHRIVVRCHEPSKRDTRLIRTYQIRPETLPELL